MNTNTPSYHQHRFFPAIIGHAVWLYHRVSLSFPDVQDLLAERNSTVSYEARRLWCLKFGPAYARKFKRRHGQPRDTWHLDELFVAYDALSSGRACLICRCKGSPRKDSNSASYDYENRRPRTGGQWEFGVFQPES